MILGIHHFTIIVSSEECVDFYKKLGFRESCRHERGYDTVVFLHGSGMELELIIDAAHPPRSKPEPLGARRLAFSVDDIEKTMGELGLQGGEIMTDCLGERFCLVRDPDGNAVELRETGES